MLKLISLLYYSILKIFGIDIKNNVTIWPLVFISKGYANSKKGEVVIASGCEISQGVIMKAYGGKITIGKNTFLGEYCIVYGHGGIEIGSNSLIAMHSCIVSSNHTVGDKCTPIRSQPDILLPVKIGDDVWIGAGVKILGGVEIGNGCVIGAGSVVTKSVPPFAVAVGVPCRVIRFRDE